MEAVEREKVEFDWAGIWARDNQIAPLGDWFTWLVLAGRGFGKTRMGSEWVRANVCGSSPLSAGRYGRVAIVGETAADCRDVLVEGVSGILASHPKDQRPIYEPSKRRLTWPNGAIATLYNGTEPDQLRGPQHDLAWIDELAKYKYAQECWDMLQFGLRIGTDPRQLVTTTPRPTPVLMDLVKDESTKITKGSTMDNAENLAPKFLEAIRRKYEGTRLGRQELNAEILDDLPGALWTRDMIDKCRVTPKNIPNMKRIVVSVDPSGTRGEPASEEKSNDIGIVVAGLGEDDEGYILEDVSCNEAPEKWAAIVVNMFKKYEADCVLAEVNYGGDLVRAVIRSVDTSIPYREVRASRGKFARAEPVAALYQQNRVHHNGALPELEDQMCLFAPTGYEGRGSPDRADAMVWAITFLMLADPVGARVFTRRRT